MNKEPGVQWRERHLQHCKAQHAEVEVLRGAVETQQKEPVIVAENGVMGKGYFTTEMMCY